MCFYGARVYILNLSSKLSALSVNSPVCYKNGILLNYKNLNFVLKQLTTFYNNSCFFVRFAALVKVAV